MFVEIAKKLCLYALCRRGVEQQRALVKSVGCPPCVLFAPAIAFEPEARVVVDYLWVAQPAPLHDVVLPTT